MSPQTVTSTYEGMIGTNVARKMWRSAARERFTIVSPPDSAMASFARSVMSHSDAFSPIENRPQKRRRS
jgi:hypothetical protein